MKCERCPKAATYHITDVIGEDQFAELHLCEGCAKKHLYEPHPTAPTVKKIANLHPGTQDDLSDLGGKACEACGMKFVEFRNSGRLGCAHDYDSFKDELVPLLDNIHGDVKHVGKIPRRLPRTRAAQTELIGLRRELQVAVQKELYEVAAGIRDRIKRLEEV